MPSILPLEEQSSRFLRRPQQDNPAATVAEYCTAVLNLDSKLCIQVYIIGESVSREESMTININRHMLGGIVTLVGVSMSSGVAAQDYPERDVTLVVQGSAGGGSDVFARHIAQVLSELGLLPRNLLVENRPGGGGTIAYNYVASRVGDPYFIGTIGSSFFTTPLLGESPVGPEDFTPLAAIGLDPYIMVVNVGSEWETLEDIAESGFVRVGTTGVVADPRLLATMLEEQMGIETAVVPFGGGGEVMSALLGDHIDVMFGNPTEIMSQLNAGEMRALAVSTPVRLTSLPDIPTFQEQGYDIEHVQLRALVMPRDMPTEALDFWTNALRQLAESDEWREAYLERFNVEPLFLDSDELSQRFEETNEMFETQMRALGLID